AVGIDPGGDAGGNLDLLAGVEMGHLAGDTAAGNPAPAAHKQVVKFNGDGASCHFGVSCSRNSCGSRCVPFVDQRQAANSLVHRYLLKALTKNGPFWRTLAAPINFGECKKSNIYRG